MNRAGLGWEEESRVMVKKNEFIFTGVVFRIRNIAFGLVSLLIRQMINHESSAIICVNIFSYVESDCQWIFDFIPNCTKILREN